MGVAVGFSVLVVLIVFLLLGVLGALRESVLLRGEVKSLSDLVRNPPPPSYVGDSAPAALRRRVPNGWGTSWGSVLVVAFVSPGCQPCERLVDGLTAATAAGQFRAQDLLWVVWAQTSDQTSALAGRLSGAVVEDLEGALSRSCEVRATPTLLALSAVDHKVIDYNLEGDIQWVLSHLTPPLPAVA